MAGWQEVWIEVGAEDAEPWSEALLIAGALSVQAQDADAHSADEQAQYGEPGMAAAGALQGWRRTRMSALLEAHADAPQCLAQAAATLGLLPPPILEIRAIADQDWVRLTQSQFAPIPIGERLVITPSWHALPSDGRTAIVLDPGLAFGTGSHPTTRLCLEWLAEHLTPGSTVIDYGCGSGILAIAAAKLGARHVIGIDIDPQALASTQANATQNAVQVQVRHSSEPTPSPADVVIANILSSPLKLLAPLLMELVRPGGWLVLSGVLERQIDEVAAAYAPRLPVTAMQCLDGWACLVGAHPG